MQQYDTSMIPDDAAYWDALGRRIATAALPRRSVAGWLSSSRGAWILAASLGCAGAVGLYATRRLDQRGRSEAPLIAALMPADRLARALIEPDSPPMLTTLSLDQPASAGGP